MEKSQKIATPKVIIQLLIVVFLIPLLPQLISGRWNWWEAWVFTISFILVFFVSRALAAKKHPDLLAERAHSMEKKDAKPWDKVLAPILALGIAFIPMAAGFDALYNASPDFSATTNLIAFLFILLGYFISTYAIVTNRFFSGLVRIQKDRDHHVVSTGPYGWVRHPGYSGTFISYLAMPFLLDSYWALLPAVLLVIVLIIRTSLEDKTLKDELEGYREYAAKVRYRLIPGIW